MRLRPIVAAAIMLAMSGAASAQDRGSCSRYLNFQSVTIIGDGCPLMVGDRFAAAIHASKSACAASFVGYWPQPMSCRYRYFVVMYV